MDEKLLQDILDGQEKFAVAVSGGIDSVCLLYMCADWAKANGKALVCLHVHHGLRTESDAELEFVKNLCHSLGVAFKSKKINVNENKKQTKTTLEEAARNLRYKALEQMADAAGAKYICLAHHAGDQAETLLLHLLRGSGVSGACAMRKVRDRYLRPLLNMPKAEIVKYAKVNKIKYMQDKSNSDTDFSRNFLRIKVLPLLEKLQTSATAHLCQFASCMQQVDQFIKEQTPAVKLKNGEVKIENNNSMLLFGRQIHDACVLLGVYQDIEQKHIEDIKQLFGKATGSQLHLPHGIIAYKDAGGVVLALKPKTLKAKEQAFGVGKFDFGSARVNVDAVSVAEYKPGIIYVDKNKLPVSCVLRYPKSGDKFKKLGASGSKLLCDYFTDKKIPQRKRANIIVLASKNNILAVLPYDVSEKVKLDKTSQILKITMEEI